MLKSLELLGFKSFADRTRFEFPRGITGIVGPNGSGKSNVVDAIKWILGDQSAKSLRGKEMIDVVFNGAAGRKPSNMAEATLAFDNSDGFLPIESREVTIGRRIWRSGDSEYLINGVSARLKDIRELLMGTGAGSSAYCIIEQGRVDQILQANANNRRQFFEEAAGISRYKARKIEAQRKLERVEQNLLRLTDIVDEVEAQLNSVRNQAEKAAKYREVSEEFRELWLGLAADDYRKHTAELDRLNERIAGYKQQSAELNRDVEQAEQQLAAIDVQLGEVDDRLRDVERRSAANREAMARHEATVRHETARSSELETELARLQRQQATMRARMQEVQHERSRNKSQLDRFETEFNERKAEVEQSKQQIRELVESITEKRQQLEQSRSQLQDLAGETSALESRASFVRSQREEAQAALRAATERREELEQKASAGRQECEIADRAVAIAQEKVDEVEAAIRAIHERQQSLAGEVGQSQQALARKREQRSALDARKNVLEDLERRQEGFGMGVKEILRRAKTANQAPWNRIRGTVADLLEVNLEQAALLEVALGSRSQLIVIDGFDSLVSYLGKGHTPIAGRVGFLDRSQQNRTSRQPSVSHGGGEAADRESGPQLPSETQNVYQFDQSQSVGRDLSQHNGVGGRADALVTASDDLPGLAEQLLADTWVVDTLEIALGLSKGDGSGCRFVTLQGELLDSDGTLTVGTVRSEAAVVSRKSELRRLKTELLELDASLQSEQSRLTTLDDSLGEIAADLTSEQARLKKHAEHLADAKSEAAARRQFLDRLLEDSNAAHTQIEKHESQLATADEELSNIRDDAEGAEVRQVVLRESIEKAEHRIATAEQEKKSLDEAAAAAELDLAKQEERLVGVRQSFQRLEQDQLQRQQQQEESQRRHQLVGGKHRHCVTQILNTGAILSELALVAEKLAAEAGLAARDKNELRAKRAGFQQEESRIRKLRRELGEVQHAEEMKVRDLRHQIGTLEERTDEEFQVALTEVVSSGASAIALFANAEANDDAPSEVDDNRAEGVDAEPGTAVVELEPNASHPGQIEPADGPVELSESDLEEIREQVVARVNRLRRKLKLMGNVSSDSLRDLDELEDRYQRLSTQLQDLVEAKSALDEIVRRINTESKRLFSKTFDNIRGHFQVLFRTMFGGGNGDVVLEDPEDVLECSIDIIARPPGKEMKSISLMSGGEKTLTALALLLAIFKSRPSPYCVLDEVDAALDEANVDRLLNLLKDYKDNTQFVMITHRKPSMGIADVLYGVTMEESGVSKRISVRFDDVSENGDFVEAAAGGRPTGSQNANSKKAA